MLILLGLIFAVLLCWFGLWLLGALWRLLDALVQGAAGGVRLFWWLAHAAARLLWTALRGLQRQAFALDLWMSQHAHAAWWSYSYWLQRAYIASQLRQRRREKHS